MPRVASIVAVLGLCGAPTFGQERDLADGRFVFEHTSGEDRVSRIEYRRVGDNGLEARVQGAENGKPFVLEHRYTRRNWRRPIRCWDI